MDEKIKVYGASWCPDCRRVKQFLGDQRVAFEWHGIEQEPHGLEIVRERNSGKSLIPTIVFKDGTSLSEPSNEDLANKIGLDRSAMMHVYDVILVGGGPAALTTSIYTPREDLLVSSTRRASGGQAGTTERLDNYPGFPDGISGSDLAERFVAQARRYGVEMIQALSVETVSRDGERLEITTANGDHYQARAVLIATGSSYRRTGAPGEEELIGAGIHFCATCDGPFYREQWPRRTVLTKFVDKVVVVEHHDKLTAHRLLQDKVTAHPKMEILLSRKVKEFRAPDDGSGKLGTVVLEDQETGETTEHHPAACFVFIGLVPNTALVEGQLSLDERGLIVTDASYMTSMRGVFAAGDVRAGSTKQLASAVGEGAAASIQIRQYLEAQLAAAGVA